LGFFRHQDAQREDDVFTQKVIWFSY